MASQVKLIAELCQNHNGDIDLLKKMIDDAAEGGATHIKIQHIHANKLVYRSCFENGQSSNGRLLCIKRPYKAEYERLKSLELSADTYQAFVQHVKSLGLIPLTTCFTRDSISEIIDQGFEEIKVASYDCASYPMIRELAKRFNYIYVSTGATFDSEIEITSDILKNQQTNHCLLHCVTIYPTNLNDLNLKRIQYLNTMSENVGYSDHTETAKDGVIASLAALYLGASVIERHYTVLKDEETRDGRVSIRQKDLQEIANFANLSKADQFLALKDKKENWEEIMMGHAKRHLSDGELLNRHYYRGRFGSCRKGYDQTEVSTIFNWDEVTL